MLDTLEAAKALMGDISASAEKRAEILLKNAELDAQIIQREAKEEAERLAEENIQLRSRFIEFRSKYKSLLESELEKFDTLANEIFGDYQTDIGACGKCERLRCGIEFGFGIFRRHEDYEKNRYRGQFRKRRLEQDQNKCEDR